jgi:hypothetical protein
MRVVEVAEIRGVVCKEGQLEEAQTELEWGA